MTLTSQMPMPSQSEHPFLNLPRLSIRRNRSIRSADNGRSRLGGQGSKRHMRTLRSAVVAPRCGQSCRRWRLESSSWLGRGRRSGDHACRDHPRRSTALGLHKGRRADGQKAHLLGTRSRRENLPSCPPVNCTARCQAHLGSRASSGLVAPATQPSPPGSRTHL